MVNMSGGIIQTAKFTCLKTGWAITNLLPVTDDKMLRKMDYLDFYKSLTNGITFHVLAEKEIECWDCEGKGILKILNQKSKSESTNRNQKTDTYFNRICPTCKGKKNAKYKVLTTLIF